VTTASSAGLSTARATYDARASASIPTCARSPPSLDCALPRSRFGYKITPLIIAYAQAGNEHVNATEAEEAAAMEALHQQYAPESLRIVLEMKGYYIKVGVPCHPHYGGGVR